MLIEYYEDYLEAHPEEAAKVVTEDGEIIFETGDPIIDHWERQYQMGLKPDFDYGKDDKKKAPEPDVEEVIDDEVLKELEEGFEDDFS